MFWLETFHITLTCLLNFNGDVKLENNLVYGVGVYSSSNSGEFIKHENIYRLWSRMLERCYSKSKSTDRRAYTGCVVSQNFKNFNTFKNWCTYQKGFGKKGFELDKDILGGVLKMYSEDICVFIPKEINVFFTKANSIRGDYVIGVSYCKRNKRYVSNISIEGKNKKLGSFDNEWSAFIAYKKAKEDRAKELANKWKDQIDDRVYNKLLEYKVLLTD